MTKSSASTKAHTGRWNTGSANLKTSISSRNAGNVPEKYGIHLPDRQLVSAPVHSPAGEEYLSSMRCAANYAFANRQVLMAKAEKTFLHALGISPRELGMELVYDVPHNIAKLEQHKVDGHEKTVCVHRKGATRAFPPGHEMIPDRYKPIG